MASTITSGTVTVSITETVSLNSTAYDAINTLTIANINEVSQRIITIPGQTVTELLEFAAGPGRGKFVSSNIQYIRITNLDDANSLAVNTQSSASNNFQLVTPGRSWMIGSVDASIMATGSTVLPAYTGQDIEKIYIWGTEVPSVDIEFFIALT